MGAASPTGGLKLSDNSSTWGGAVVRWQDGNYHMFASRMVNGCGLSDWTTNSQVVHAVSATPEGPYTLTEKPIVLDTFAHDTNAILAPSGEVVLFVTARANVKPKNCSDEASLGGNESLANSTVYPKHSYMLWAAHPDGPWSEPVLVLNSTHWNSDYWNKTGKVAQCDGNLNGIIHDDGSFLGLWRRCETPSLLTIPHRLTASDWRNASTYAPDPTPLFVLGGSGAEDPSNIWITQSLDGTMAYHALFHDEQATRCMLPTGCSANGRHAFSLNGISWRYAGEDAWTRNVTFTDGSSIESNTRARPHVILGPAGQPSHLTNGLKPTAESDYVWTVVVPLI